MTLSYELAISLKNAGFPQNGEEIYFRDDIRKENWEPRYVASDQSLSKLIEACGDGFWRMMKAGGSWVVEGGIGISELRTFGFTPEEAVAMLWLALNEKPNNN